MPKREGDRGGDTKQTEGAITIRQPLDEACLWVFVSEERFAGRDAVEEGQTKGGGFVEGVATPGVVPVGRVVGKATLFDVGVCYIFLCVCVCESWSMLAMECGGLWRDCIDR